jgi:hypothetical protein
MKPLPLWLCLLSGLAAATILPTPAAETSERSASPISQTARLAFTATETGEYHFDTGLLRGKLRAGGKSLGLSSVIHVPTGTTIDRSNGLLGHYRVFTKGVRYGGGAWDWSSTARLRDDGAVEVHWPPAEGRPFELQAVYQWAATNALDVQTVVKARKELRGFEVFLASYFAESFTNAAVWVKADSGSGASPTLAEAAAANGDWQIFPRDEQAIRLINDGRWKLEPNPVAWTIRPTLEMPAALRRNPQTGFTALVMAPRDQCFAIAMPHQTEGHYSLYFSLFGRDVAAGEVVRANARLVITSGVTGDRIDSTYRQYIQALSRGR